MVGRKKSRPKKRSRQSSGVSTSSIESVAWSPQNAANSTGPQAPSGDTVTPESISEKAATKTDAQHANATQPQPDLDKILAGISELKSGQLAMRNSFNSRIDKLRNEILVKFENQAAELTAYTDTRVEAGISEVRQYAQRNLKKLDDNLAALLQRVEVLEKDGTASAAGTAPAAAGTSSGAGTASVAAAGYSDAATQKKLRYKQMDLEARSRRNNLVFYNIPESDGEDVPEKLRTFVKEKLSINQTVAIQRAHRLGRRTPPNAGKSRPIIACFRDYPDVDMILSSANRLKGTRLGISRDYPEEIRRARGRLQADRRQARQDGKRAVIAYPAKLIVDGEVVRNEFPDWSSIMRDEPRTEGL